jgi:uncharacterized protein DUF4136
MLAIVMALQSCSTVKVVVDMDKTADFSGYETYSFLGWQNDSDEILNEFDKKRIRDAFISEFERRGLKPVADKGDMEISLFIVVDKKTSVTAYTDYYGGRYGMYSRYRGGWGYGYGSTSYYENDYLKGTLVMDVFDGKSKDQVWQGIATKTVNEKPAKRKKTVPANIRALMRKFPIQAK